MDDGNTKFPKYYEGNTKIREDFINSETLTKGTSHFTQIQFGYLLGLQSLHNYLLHFFLYERRLIFLFGSICFVT